jgi:ATP:ADP antiporter, AAA family
MKITPTGSERMRFVTMALLFFANAVVEASNEVASTSGFISHVGVVNILWMKAADAIIIIFAAGAYALIVDRAQRRKLAMALFLGFGGCYAVIVLLFALNVSSGIGYTALNLINGQQDNLIPLVLGALAADIFSVAESKRLFGLLAAANVAGELAGNGFAIGVARLFNGNNEGLLIANVVWLMAGAAMLAVPLRHIEPGTRQASEEERLVDVLRGGINYMRDVRLFRYLTIAVLLGGTGWSVVQYRLLFTLSETFPDTDDLQASYGVFKFAIPVLLLLVQAAGLRWLMRWWGFKSIFSIMAGVLLVGLTLMLAWPGLASVIGGSYLAKITSRGVQEPGERSFLGLVPDELRGRMGAFLHGVLYPFGEMLGYIFVGVVLLLTNSAQTAWAIYGGAAMVCLVLAVSAALRLRTTYDQEMLNWRWQRRRRQSLVELGL